MVDLQINIVLSKVHDGTKRSKLIICKNMGGVIYEGRITMYDLIGFEKSYIVNRKL